MIMITHEYYVSLEVAKLLAEVGFDWKCKTYYNTSVYLDETVIDDEPRDYNFMNGSIIFSAPTLAVAQRWLREVRREYVVVHPIVNKWFYSIHRPNFGHYYRDKKFSTYEEAQEAGIKKALELILEKGE